jgi:hypothetical protein
MRPVCVVPRTTGLSRLSAAGHLLLGATLGARGADRLSSAARPDARPSPEEETSAVPRPPDPTGLARHRRLRLPSARRHRETASGPLVPAPTRSRTSSPATGSPPEHSSSPALASPAMTAHRAGAAARLAGLATCQPGQLPQLLAVVPLRQPDCREDREMLVSEVSGTAPACLLRRNLGYVPIGHVIIVAHAVSAGAFRHARAPPGYRCSPLRPPPP